MKKVIYTIGRDSDCDICIFDTNNLISRNHATLIIRNGKYYIIDHSMNGTYVNGIKIVSEREVPVTRKDFITFAHVAEFDWGLIPNQKRKTVIGVSIGLLVALLIVFLVGMFITYEDKMTPGSGDGKVTTTMIDDSLSISYPHQTKASDSKPKRKFIDRIPSKEKPKDESNETEKSKVTEESEKGTKESIDTVVVVKETVDTLEVINAIY